jgi:hypothetical protein
MCIIHVLEIYTFYLTKTIFSSCVRMQFTVHSSMLLLFSKLKNCICLCVYSSSIVTCFAILYNQSSMEHRKLAVDLADVIIKWELQRIKEDAEADTVEVCFHMSCCGLPG